MAKQTIDIGTVANDGTGDPLRTAMTKTNDNFTELYQVGGWGNYKDAATTPATQSITTTPSLMQVDGAGATSNSDYLPGEIRGVSELWDNVNDKILPINIGDSYEVRVDITVTAKSGSAGTIYLQLDIGGAATPTIVVVEEDIVISKTVPFIVSIPFPIFCLSTFKTNGGQIFLTADTGTITIGDRGISIYRLSSGGL